MVFAKPPNSLNVRETDDLRLIYAQVDREVARLVTLHSERLRCSEGCFHCCQDEMTVFEVEADRIRQNHAALLQHGTPGPHGMCAFLNEAGACRIYEHRPYVCRTQGLPLQWEEEVDAEETLLYRSICPLNEAGPPLESLPDEACWTLGEIEPLLATAQARRGQPLQRVALRDLFEKKTQARVEPSPPEALEV